MPDYASFKSEGITVDYSEPNPYLKLHPGCMVIFPSDELTQINHVGITRLLNWAAEIIPINLEDLLSPESEIRFPTAAFFHDRLAMNAGRSKLISIVYFPQDISTDTNDGAMIGIETALISAFGYEPEIKSPTTLVYHRGKPLISVNGQKDERKIITDEPSLALLYAVLKEILQPSLAQVKVQTLHRHTDPESINFKVEPSKMFS